MIPKFRAFHKELKIMKEVACINLLHEEIKIDSEFGETWFADKFELMQCTGLQDANNQEVCVGDIIEYSSMASSFILPETPDVVIRQVVIFEDGIFGVKFGDHLYIEPLRNSFKYNRSEIKVIGNIYEHAHLLEKKCKS